MEQIEIKWAVHMARMKNTILIGKYKEKGTPERPSTRWKNGDVNVKERGLKVRIGLNDPGQGPATGSRDL
jgi:hypothetical protein